MTSPAETIKAKTSNISLVIALASALAGAAGSVGTYAVARYRLDQLEFRVSRNEDRILKQETVSAAAAVEFQRVKDDIAHTREAVDDIKHLLQTGLYVRPSVQRR